MAHPFKQTMDEHTREIQMQEFYNSLDDHLKGEYRTIQVYQLRLQELREEFLDLEIQGNGMICHKLKGSIATIDKYLSGDYSGMNDCMPLLRQCLETVIIEVESDLSVLKSKLSPKNFDKQLIWDSYVCGGKYNG